MTKTEWIGHREFTTGRKVKRFSSPILIAKTGRREMTAAEYAQHWMGRGRMVNGETAFAQKMERMGFTAIEGTNRYHRFVRL